MGSIDESVPSGAAAWVQRQACMAIRNIAARSPELRPPILAKVRQCALSSQVAALRFVLYDRIDLAYKSLLR